jgi:glucose-1-phosphate thymidylyltransferase
LLQYGNITVERLNGYAVLQVNESYELTRVEEKPAVIDPEALISMNSWSLTPGIFEACAAIAPSARGEYELPSAVQFAIENLRQPFHVIAYCGGVLDLSTRGDIAAVGRHLEHISVQL